MAVDVHHVDACDPEVVEAFCRDAAQLSSRPSRLKPEVLAELIASPVYHVLIARTDAGIRATLILAAYRSIHRMKARIDDVVADQTEDGQTAAVALVQEALRCAAEAGAPVITLVSKPTLPVANRTYERLGFTQDGPALYRRTVAGFPA